MRPLLSRHPLLSTALAAAFGTVFLSLSVPLAVHAQTADPAAAVQPGFDVQVPAQDLAAALNDLSRQTGTPIFAAGDLVSGLTSRAVSGRLTVEQALRALLAGTGLDATRASNGGFAVRRASPAPRATVSTLPAVFAKTSDTGESATGPVSGYVAKRSATGTKTDTPIIETPQSLSVVTADRIEAIGATRLVEALGYTPGVTLDPSGNDSRNDTINLRGFDAFSPGFYLDGMQMRNVRSFSTWHTENYGTERIEVLRGPASVLYGQSSPGGMVNVVSKRPLAEPLHEVQAQIGNYQRRQVAADFSGPVDAEGKWLYRVTGLARDAELDIGGLRSDRQFLAPSLAWKPNNGTSLTLLSHYLRNRAGSDWRFHPLNGTLRPNPNGPIPRDTFLGDKAASRFDFDQWMVGYLFEHKIDDTWTVRNNARYGRQETHYQDMFGIFFKTDADPLLPPSAPANNRVLQRVFSGGREHMKTVTTDTHLEGKLQAGDWRHTVLVGLDYQRTQIDAVDRSTSGPLDPGNTVDDYAPNNNQNLTLPGDGLSATRALHQTGLYVQDQIKFQDRWVASVGARYDSASSRSEGRTTGTLDEQSDQKLTKRVGLVYLAPNGLAPYISHSQSFSPTSQIDLSTGKAFVPETGRQVEAGLRYQPAGRADSYSVAVFDLKRRNYVTVDPSLPPGSNSRQVGEITVRGLELEAQVQPIKRMNLSASYTWMPKAEVTQSANPAEIGKQANAIPENQLSVWGDYRFAFGLKAGLGARYVGSNRGTNSFFLGSEQVPAYTLVDAMLGYQWDRWNLSINARNLTDKVYLAACGVGGCNYGEPRKVTATLSYRW